MSPVPIIFGLLGPVTEQFGAILKITLGENGWEEWATVSPGGRNKAAVEPT